MYASGPVAIWHEMDIAAESHIQRANFVVNVSLFLSPGQNFCRMGNMYAIPAMAAYDS